MFRSSPAPCLTSTTYAIKLSLPNKQLFGKDCHPPHLFALGTHAKHQNVATRNCGLLCRGRASRRGEHQRINCTRYQELTHRSSLTLLLVRRTIDDPTERRLTIADIKSLTSSSPNIISQLVPTFEKYNEEQLVTVKLPGSSQSVLVPSERVGTFANTDSRRYRFLSAPITSSMTVAITMSRAPPALRSTTRHRYTTQWQHWNSAADDGTESKRSSKLRCGRSTSRPGVRLRDIEQGGIVTDDLLVNRP